MRTYNLRYRSLDKLKDFVAGHAIVDSPALLIQIFSYSLDQRRVTTILSHLRKLFPSAVIAGTTTDGEVLDGRILDKDIVISFTAFEKTELRIAAFTEKRESLERGREIAGKLVDAETKVLLLYVRSNEIDAPRLLEGIHERYPKLLISGGLTADQGRFEDGFVMHGERILTEGVVAIALEGDALIAHNYYTSQWEPVGKAFTITKSKQNRLISVDKMSVQSLYARYLGEEIAKNLPLSGLQFPFVLQREDGYIARTPLWDPGDGSLVFATHMREGESVQIGFGDARKMLSNVEKITREALQKPIESIFVFASAGRRRFLKELALYEVQPLSQIAPVSGFYGYGEFIANEKERLFLNQSFTFLTLSESDTPPQRDLHFRAFTDPHGDLQTLRALSNIAKVSSMELQELNQKLESRIRDEVAKNRKKDSILIHNSKLAQMGEMMSLIAHQWRQPLSAISATSTGLHVKLELGKFDEAFFLSSLDKIEGYVRHLSETIDDFTNFFKPTKKSELTTCGYIIERALFIMSSSLRKHSIDVMVDNSAPDAFHTHPNEVIQVLINLIKNAENILIKREIAKPIISITAYERDRHRYIEVSDNAGGIDEAIIDKIFEPYFTTKNAKDSTGLGLYMSRFIIEESCGGKLTVTNSNEGALFTIRL
ncbi:MAG TPA: hypothetical protein ENK93_01145 [Campylobacteraceae bacterium]|nr:hypothetical protein [Campylobacteraceae bacterium]